MMATLEGDQNTLLIALATQVSMTSSQWTQLKQVFARALTTEKRNLLPCAGNDPDRTKCSSVLRDEAITLLNDRGGKNMREREYPELAGQTGLLAFLRPPRQFLNGPSWGGKKDKKKLKGKMRQRRMLEAGFGV